MSRRRTVTLTADGELYDVVKERLGISPSWLLEVAMKAVLQAAEEEELEFVVQKAVLEARRKELLQAMVKLEAVIEEARKRLEILRREVGVVEQQIERLEQEAKLQRLQRLVKRLKEIAKMVGYDVKAVRQIPEAMEIERQIREIKPEFELERYVELWKLYDL